MEGGVQITDPNSRGRPVWPEPEGTHTTVRVPKSQHSAAAECGRQGGRQGRGHVTGPQPPRTIEPAATEQESLTAPVLGQQRCVLSTGNPPAHPPGGRGHQGTG